MPSHIDLHAYGSNSNVNHYECTTRQTHLRGGRKGAQEEIKGQGDRRIFLGGYGVWSERGETGVIALRMQGLSRMDPWWHSHSQDAVHQGFHAR